jgi:hypothetical protein
MSRPNPDTSLGEAIATLCTPIFMVSFVSY